MRFLIVTLGCAKNEVDSDRMRALLLAAGFEETAEAGDADVALVNQADVAPDAARELAVLLATPAYVGSVHAGFAQRP